MNLKKGKFIFRIVISLLVFGFGVAIYFTTSDPNAKTAGVGIASTIFGTWMSSGTTSITKLKSTKTKDKKPAELKEIVVDDNIEDFLKSLDNKNNEKNDVNNE